MTRPATGLQVGVGAPVTPDAEKARRWARDELADEVYREAEPGLFARVVEWVLERLAQIELPEGPGSRLLLAGLLVLLAAGVVVVLALAGPVRLHGRRAAAREVFDGAVRSAAEHRRAADEHAAAGRWHDAVRERFRAVARALEERALLTLVPGRTADEVAREAGLLLPDIAVRLTEGARIFDDVCYGDREATPEHDARLRSLDTAVAAARPQLTQARP